MPSLILHTVYLKVCLSYFRTSPVGVFLSTLNSLLIARNGSSVLNLLCCPSRFHSISTVNRYSEYFLSFMCSPIPYSVVVQKQMLALLAVLWSAE